jgi:hypothetical protein
MIAIDTDEKLNWFINGIENGDIIIDSRHMTKEERGDMRREIAEYKAMKQQTKKEEAVLA